MLSFPVGQSPQGVIHALREPHPLSSPTRATSSLIPDRSFVITTLNELNLIPELIDAVADMGYTEATPIQAGAIPAVLAGRDVIGCAATGTGKTAAFLLPMLQLLHLGDPGRCRALVLSPTRELALQIDEQALALGYHLGLSAAAVVGCSTTCASATST
jgi:superfamily II DNA/RNA helicase